jgi:hypothetical protein
MFTFPVEANQRYIIHSSTIYTQLTWISIARNALWLHAFSSLRSYRETNFTLVFKYVIYIRKQYRVLSLPLCFILSFPLLSALFSITSILLYFSLAPFSLPPFLSFISFFIVPRPLYPWGKSPRYPLYRKLGVPQSRSGRRGEKKILDFTGTRTLTPPGSSS